MVKCVLSMLRALGMTPSTTLRRRKGESSQVDKSSGLMVGRGGLQAVENGVVVFNTF